MILCNFDVCRSGNCRCYNNGIHPEFTKLTDHKSFDIITFLVSSGFSHYRGNEYLTPFKQIIYIDLNSISTEEEFWSYISKIYQ